MVSEHCSLLQVYQLTTLFSHGPVDDIPKFTVRLDAVAINHRSIESTIACFQRFLRAPSVAQNDCLSDKGIGVLMHTVTAAAVVFEE